MPNTLSNPVPPRVTIVTSMFAAMLRRRSSELAGSEAWLQALSEYVGAPACIVSSVGDDRRVTGAAVNIRHNETIDLLIGSRARTLPEWAPLFDGTLDHTEVDHNRSSRPFRSAMTYVGSNSVLHVPAFAGDGSVAAVISVVGSLVNGRRVDVVRTTSRVAELLAWLLRQPPLAELPLCDVAEFRNDPREIVAAMTDALETLAPPVVHLPDLSSPAVANAAARGALYGAPSTPRSILAHRLVGDDLFAEALFDDDGLAVRDSPHGVTKLRVLRRRPGVIDGVVIVLPREHPPAPARASAPAPATAVVPPEWNLSRREAEVIALLVQGDRVATIAQRLYVSQETVRGHLKSVYRKVGVTSQSELIMAARGASGSTPRGAQVSTAARIPGAAGR